MPDREKVIKELTCCIYSEEECECPEDCPYVDDDMSECQANVMRDALALLKEQEADIIAMSRFLESHGWDSDSICGKNVEIVVTNGDDNDA